MARVTDGPKIGHLQTARWELGDRNNVIDFGGLGAAAMSAELTGVQIAGQHCQPHLRPAIRIAALQCGAAVSFSLAGMPLAQSVLDQFWAAGSATWPKQRCGRLRIWLNCQVLGTQKFD